MSLNDELNGFNKSSYQCMVDISNSIVSSLKKISQDVTLPVGLRERVSKQLDDELILITKLKKDFSN